MRRYALAIALAALAAPAAAQDVLPFAPTMPNLLTPDPLHPAAPQFETLVPQNPRARLNALIASHARLNGVPESLIHRVIKRESRYNAAARGRGGAMGLMQIKHATARALGYAGPAAGLLDPDTNLTYAVRYLAGALRAAQGNVERGYALYRSGYNAPRKAALARAHHRAAPERHEADALGLRPAQ